MARSRARSRRAWWIGGGLLVVAVVGIAAWLGTSWLGTYRQAEAVQADVSLLRSALTAQDWTSVAAQVPTLAISSRALADETAGVPWRVLSALPVVGSTASAVDDLAGAVADLAEAADPLTPYAERIVAGDIRTPDGGVDVASLASVAPLLERLSVAVDTATRRLDAVDVASVRPEVAGPIGELRTQLADAAPALRTATDLAVNLPGLLGADGPRSWAVLLQNPAEARGSGGFIGGYVVVQVENGSVRVTDSGTSTDLAQVKIPVEAVPADSMELWGESIEDWNMMNRTAHFPLVGELAAAGMGARGEPVDGVIAVDPAFVAALLSVTGPVEARGVTIDADTVEQFFTVDIYRQFPDAVERDEVSMALVAATLRAFLAGAWEPTQLAESLGSSVGDGHLKAWSSAADEQEWLLAGPAGGGVPDVQGSVLTVAFNNTAPSKMDAFVSTSVEYRPGRCPTASTQRSTVRITVRNDAPVDLPEEGGNYGRLDVPNSPEGSTSQAIYLYAPVGANYLSSTIDGQDAPLYARTEQNRPVWYENFSMDRGQERTIEVLFEEPTVLGVEPEVLAQPMVIPEEVTVIPDTTCP